MTQATTQQKRRAILMVVAFTIVAAIAQPLFKTGANRLSANPSIAGLITDIPLIAGLALYGFGSVLMILALRHGELSVLYPIISLSYVWVAILAVIFFHEHMTPFRISGIFTIIAGVSVMGRDARR